MNFLPSTVLLLSFVVAIISGSFSSISEEWKAVCECNLSKLNNHAKTGNCKTTALWKVTSDTNCTASEYLKITVFPANDDPLNRVEQCTMTPCDQTEKTPADCNVAFSAAKLAEIAKEEKSKMII
ncbi:UPF0375 protein Y45F10C.4 [Caenorhabditis elegans]|uniref:UPF0375 protein Y45F10C.4 n=1 Tax=Caenorhabditis elegans TaxID=6239 RepID=U375F_CAEEL|nr:UPF0375 protein Y45F10C.4 [Caenorhabditis elegans]O45944.1 RecName: Full=UPF0375 protein Y45F10C.4; Flags: Precursor [Caenorhabditis elegans]CAB16479.1 UPF0375 protein Y45F10C.4 [Caenorhabditis elegans]|eukprot:NP_502640.1 UPF0375 protein Y45F10C.4 [Caenorhabditis elegans]